MCEGVCVRGVCVCVCVCEWCGCVCCVYKALHEFDK